MNKDIEYYTFQYTIPIYKIKPPQEFCDYYQTHKDEIIVELDKEKQQLQQKVNQLEEKEELHLNRIDELIDEIVKLKRNRNKAIKLLKRGTTFCENDSYGGYEVCKIAIKRESKAIEILERGE